MTDLLTDASENRDGAIKHSHKGRPREFDKEKALQAALKVFWEKGYEPATLPDLCSAMGINPPSLYRAFGNKSQLFLEALKYYEEKYWAIPSKNFLDNPDIYKGIEDFFQEAATIILSPQTPCGCMAVVAAVNISAEEKEIIEEITQMRQSTRNMFINRLRIAIQNGEIPPASDVPVIANALNTFLEGMSMQAKGGLFLSELQSLAKQAINFLPVRVALQSQ